MSPSRTTRTPCRAGGRAWRLAPALTLALVLTACGSTVRVGVSEPGGDAQLADADAADSGLEYVPPADGTTSTSGGLDGTSLTGGSGAPTTSTGTATTGLPGGTASSGSSGSGGGTTGAATTGGTTTTTGGRGGAPSEPLRLGIVVPEGNAAGAFGGALAFEDYPQIARALVDALNDDGGIAGRRIEPVIREASQDDQSQEAQTRQANEICASLTEDDPVDLVVADGTTGTNYAFDCYAQHETPVMQGASGESFRIRDLRPWVLPFPLATYDRTAEEIPRFLAAQDAMSDRIGILAFDIPELRRAVEEHLKPAIARHGGTVAETVYMAVTYQDVGAQVSAAVLRFKAEGIDLVLPSFASGGAVTAIFMHEAESQAYYPRYGLSSLDAPVVVDDTLGAPASQMANSFGLGFDPTRDIPQSQYPPTPREQECWETVNERLGTSYSSRSPTDANGYAAIQLCDLLWLVDAALDPATGRAVAASQVIEYIEALGDRYTPVRVPRSKFGPGRTDGAAVMRGFVFDRSGCSCFTYSGDWFPVG